MSLFTVTGASKALELGVGPAQAILLGAADDPVNLPNGRVREPAAHMRFAGPPARVAASGVGWDARRSIVLVAAVRLTGSVLKVRPAVAVLTAAPELGVEGVQRFHVEPA